jgi:hypothetical protein
MFFAKKNILREASPTATFFLRNLYILGTNVPTRLFNTVDHKGRNNKKQ